MSRSRYILHAKHNKKACDYLNDKGEFSDWVITTAFYSAMYYLYDAIFPYTYEFPEGKTVVYKDFDKLYNQFASGNQNKHNYFKKFIDNNFDYQVSVAYSQLKDLCWNARYVDYEMDKIEATIARKRLKQIIAYCV
ncbi:MAG: hypothetical protein K9G70_06965 [Prolixibacteraceae bacterium]|nr:hypothetical protein [Prolixibacteraceae bacterium]